MTPPVFFFAAAVACSPGSVVVLDGAEGHHAAAARRSRPGELLVVTDGRGAAAVGSVVSVGRDRVEVTVESASVVPASRPRLVVAQALAKGGRDEAAIEAMTEIGVDEVLGWAAARSIARWTDRTLPKWTATVTAAAKQSRRVWWPSVSGPLSTDELATRCRSADLAMVLHAGAVERLVDISVPVEGSVLVVVGPEGGIDDAELQSLADAGAVPVRLGTEVLRSSTAGVAALSAICAVTRWRGTPAD